MRTTTMLICAAVALASSLASAQPAGPDPLAENVFPPELVFSQQQAIALTDRQKELLRTDVRQAQTRFTDLQWQLGDEVEKLASLLKPDNPDEPRVIAQLDRVLDVERDVKRAQIGLLVRIKNRLTHEQQAKLRELNPRPAPR